MERDILIDKVDLIANKDKHLVTELSENIKNKL